MATRLRLNDPEQGPEYDNLGELAGDLMFQRPGDPFEGVKLGSSMALHDPDRAGETKVGTLFFKLWANSVEVDWPRTYHGLDAEFSRENRAVIAEQVGLLYQNRFERATHAIAVAMDQNRPGDPRRPESFEEGFAAIRRARGDYAFSLPPEKSDAGEKTEVLSQKVEQWVEEFRSPEGFAREPKNILPILDSDDLDILEAGFDQAVEENMGTEQITLRAQDLLAFSAMTAGAPHEGIEFRVKQGFEIALKSDPHAFDMAREMYEKRFPWAPRPVLPEPGEESTEEDDEDLAPRGP